MEPLHQSLLSGVLKFLGQPDADSAAAWVRTLRDLQTKSEGERPEKEGCAHCKTKLAGV